MKNKKSLMSNSLIMILIFHLWIPVLSYNNNFSMYETYLRYICYIGVDIFFFVSGASLASKEIKYKEFIKNRFINIYYKFIIFTIIASIYKNWSLINFLSIITGYSLFKSGGGSFLWFIPAIMIMYLFMPIYKKIDNKHKIITPILFTIIFGILIIILNVINYNELFIFLNRMPIFLLGYYISKYNLLEKLQNKKIMYIFIMTILIIIGNYISYNTFINNFKFSYFKEIFYILNIPLILGIILLFDLIPKNKVYDVLGNITLESYGLQMIIGYKLINRIYMTLNSAIIAFLLSCIILIIISLIFNKLFKKIIKTLERR